MSKSVYDLKSITIILNISIMTPEAPVRFLKKYAQVPVNRSIKTKISQYCFGCFRKHFTVFFLAITKGLSFLDKLSRGNPAERIRMGCGLLPPLLFLRPT